MTLPSAIRFRCPHVTFSLILLDKLSDKQIEAVNAIDEDVEIIACAGAGKTGVVTRRIINILKSKPEVHPENIVAFTFTKKAAEELKSRIYSMGQAALGNTQGFANMYIGTIHGFCLQMLQEFLPEFQSFSVLDEIHTKLFVERYYEDTLNVPIVSSYPCSTVFSSRSRS